MISRILEAYRQAFSGLPRSVWQLAAITLVHRSGTMVLPFLTLYVTLDLEMAPSSSGIFLGIYGLGAMTGAYFGGRLSDRIGPMRAQQLCLSAAAMGFFVLAFAKEPGPLAVMVYLTAAAVEAFRPPNAAALAELAPEDALFRAFALRRLAINIGMTLGPAAGGLLASHDYFWLFICDGATCLLAAVLLWRIFRHHRREMESRDGGDVGVARASPWHDRPFVVLAALVCVLSLVFFQLLATYPLTLHDVFELEEHTIGILFAINTLLIIAFEMVLVHAVGRFHPLKVAAVGAFLTCTGLGMLPLGSSIAFICFTIVIWTFGEMLSHPLLEGLAADRAPAASRGAFLGFYNANFALAFVVAPPLGTWVYDTLGYRALWLGCGVIGIVLTLAFWALSRYFEREPAG